MPEARTVTLYKTEGSSDKEYHAILRPADQGDGWIVDYRNGKRGRATAGGTKTKDPVPYDEAVVIHAKLVQSKVKGGYTEEVTGAAFTTSEFAGRVAGFRPQLLNPVTREQGRGLPDHWLAQEKHNGERRPVLVRSADDIVFTNRDGLIVNVAEHHLIAVRALAEFAGFDFKLDCEDMGDHLMIFDLPKWGDIDETRPFSMRARMLARLEQYIEAIGADGVLKVDVPMVFSEFRTTRLPEIEARGGEGYVVKDPDATYEPGRPSKDGPAIKVKFTESATCRVAGQNGSKRSVAIELMNRDGDWTPVGNVTIPANHDVPGQGSIVEVEYLYAHRGGSIFQPVYLGTRNDRGEDACVMRQLKWRDEGFDLEEEGPAPGM